MHERRVQPKADMGPMTAVPEEVDWRRLLGIMVKRVAVLEGRASRESGGNGGIVEDMVDAVEDHGRAFAGVREECQRIAPKPSGSGKLPENTNSRV